MREAVKDEGLGPSQVTLASVVKGAVFMLSFQVELLFPENPWKFSEVLMSNVCTTYIKLCHMKSELELVSLICHVSQHLVSSYHLLAFLSHKPTITVVPTDFLGEVSSKWKAKSDLM
jgi:hypothetical protein